MRQTEAKAQRRQTMKRRIIPRNRKWWLFALLFALQTLCFLAACGDSPTESRQYQPKEKEEKDDQE
jgi:hypothetical protein